jgi:hypothetical protein
MQKGRMYGIGVLLTIIGATGLEGITMTDHGCFWLCAVLFSVGFVMCCASYRKDE